MLYNLHPIIYSLAEVFKHVCLKQDLFTVQYRQATTNYISKVQFLFLFWGLLITHSYNYSLVLYWNWVVTRCTCHNKIFRSLCHKLAIFITVNASRYRSHRRKIQSFIVVCVSLLWHLLSYRQETINTSISLSNVQSCVYIYIYLYIYIYIDRTTWANI